MTKIPNQPPLGGVLATPTRSSFLGLGGLQDKSVLLIDRDPDLADLVRDLLREHSANVVSVLPSQLPDILQKKMIFDVICADVHRGLWSELERVRFLCSPLFRFAVLIAMSGNMRLELGALAKFGISALIRKPNDFDEVATVAMNLLSGSPPTWRPGGNRVPVHFPVQLRLQNRFLTLEAKALNMSANGMMISMQGLLPEIGAKMQFKMPWSRAYPLLGTATVRWVNPSSFSKKAVDFGIEFQSVSNHVRHEVGALVQRLEEQFRIPHKNTGA